MKKVYHPRCIDVLNALLTCLRANLHWTNFKTIVRKIRRATCAVVSLRNLFFYCACIYYVMTLLRMWLGEFF